MKLLEYQAKELFRRHGIPVPKLGGVVSSLKDLSPALRKAGKPPWVIKAQVLAGGRGKAGGVRLVRSAKEAEEFVKGLLGKSLVTHQTSPEGVRVSKLLVEQALKISREMYLSLVLSRKLEGPVFLASAEGGMEIEDLARRSPGKVLQMPLDPCAGAHSFQVRQLLYGLGLPSSCSEQFSVLVRSLARLYLNLDCSLVEINPLVLTKEGELSALDAKMSLDDNALFRHPEMRRYASASSEETASEKQAKRAGISYVALTGSIGCMVNGAGLAMSTMDEIQRQGGAPANFLDVGGGAGVEQVSRAFEILVQDRKVRSVLVNIFGGIMKCDVIAQGILGALKKVPLRVPLVVRLEGTRVEEGKALLRDSGLRIIQADDLADAAGKAIQVAKES